MVEITVIATLSIAILSLFFEDLRLKKRNDLLETENRSLRDTRDKLFQYMLSEIMEGDVPIDQILSPFPLIPPGKRVDTLEIILPENGSKVSPQSYVEGVIPDYKAKLWVIVHPLTAPTYQVQPKGTVWEDGTWRVRISLRKIKGGHLGKSFEMMAVGDPKVPVKEDDIFSNWPEGQWKSKVIEVFRK